MKKFLTNYEDNCILCGTPIISELHHLIYGTSSRKISDVDGLVIPVCRFCHDEIHKCGVAGKMSKIIGQLVWKLNYVSNIEDILNARNSFRKRYGRSYL